VSSTPGIGKKVLLVDDDSDITLTYSLALEDSGYVVDTYNDPLIALARFKPNFYDLLLLDVRMPQMNGLELYEQIKKMDGNVRVCFISAFNLEDKTEREQFPPMQIDCFIPKPVEVGELLKTLEILLLK
jgi:two-component system, OmpR family, response regulator ChvI